MSISSNLYADKVFAEHPTALWALDEKLDYISLISESQRDIQDSWTYSDVTISESLDQDKIFKDSILNLIEFNEFTEQTKEIKFVGPSIINLSSLNSSIGTLCIGSYFKTTGAYLKSVTIGFEYTDTSSGDIEEVVYKYNTSVSNKWFFISNTFNYPIQNTSIRPVIKVEFFGNAASTESYQILINGLSIGQGSENFNTYSLGTETINFPNNINLDNTSKCFITNSYGMESNKGYYLVDNNNIVSQNTGIPIVYGSSNCTQIFPNNNLPSLIIPGLGFLNNVGKYKNYTIEMWLKINFDSSSPIKIFGPIASNDGIYVEGGFISLVIGNNFKSHYVGQWDRPMLIQIRVSENNASMILNGEEVINLFFLTSEIIFPNEYENNKSNDWLGFYSNPAISLFQIDCVSIYSYLMSVPMTKRRWVFGQAVSSPEDINSAYNGISAYIDYPFAEYTANYSYPSFGSWSQGSFDNLISNKNSLNIPNYSLPEIYLDGLSINKLYSDNLVVQDSENKFLTLRPTPAWDNKNTYINFPQFNIINDEIHSLHAVVSAEEYISEEQLIFQIYDNNNNEIKVVLKDADILYSVSSNGLTEVIHIIQNYPLSTKIALGINFENISKYFGTTINNLLSNKNNLQMYFAGNNKGYAFLGKIFSLGVSSSYNSNKLLDYFDEQGFAKFDEAESFLSTLSSYTLLPSEKYGSFYLDIGISGYWQDYIPLSYFGSYVNNGSGESIYDLDFLQFNIDYPSPSKSIENQSGSSWTYTELDDTYDHPIQKQYGQIDNYLFTGWDNYEELKTNSTYKSEMVTDGAAIKSYVTLQYISEGANKTLQSYPTKKRINYDRILDFSKETGWNSNAYEVVDNALIYPPLNIDFNKLALTTHLEFDIPGIFTNPIALRSLQYSSKSLNHAEFNKVGTRFGVPIYPYTKSGFYYDYKAKNPFSIYKQSTPYLYTTKNSGIEVRGTFDPFINRGLSIPLNESLSNNFSINAIQSWIRYDFDKFTYGPLQLLEIEHKGDTIQIFAEANSQLGNRARIFAINRSTQSTPNGISFYINGKLVKEPVINIKEWSVLAISFANSLNLENYLGSINLNGPFVYNNITFYKSSSLQQIQSKTYRPWLKVKTTGIEDLEWSFWNDSYLWEGVLVVAATDLYGVNPESVYSSYIGNNKIVIDSSSENIWLNQDTIRIFSNTEWKSSIGTPV